MAPLAGFIQLVLALILAIVGMWSAVFLAPWAFFGDRPDYVYLAIACSPLLLSAILFGSAFLTLSATRATRRTEETGTRPGEAAKEPGRPRGTPQPDSEGP